MIPSDPEALVVMVARVSKVVIGTRAIAVMALLTRNLTDLTVTIIVLVFDQSVVVALLASYLIAVQTASDPRTY